MSTLTIPNTFTNNVSTVDAVTTNANNSAIQTAVNNIDHTNIGASGLYATNLIPTTTAQAIFGGSVGYTFYPNAAAVVPLTVSGTTSQSVDLFDVTLTSGGTKAFVINSAGTVIVTGGNIEMLSGGTLEITALASISVPTGAGNGDAIFQRTASTGSIFIGGLTAWVQIDFGVTTANLTTLTGGGTGTGDLFLGSTGSRFLTAGGMTATTAARTVAAGQIGYGSTTTTSATAGSNGNTPVQVAGYIVVNVAGTSQRIPYYNA